MPEVDRKLTRSYQCNYQVKRRRRREGKTDYKHRTNMLRQHCNSYGSVKSRLVVRITGSKVICAVVKAYIDGDRTVAYADSTELKKYGVDFGLTNYFAAYATGLLCGRRALISNGLEKVYEPTTEVGEYGVTEDKEGEASAYKVFLDIGLARSSTGANVFGACKGASDAGLQIPHSEKRLYGYTEEDGLDAKTLRDRIYLKHVVEYMKKLKEEDEEKYKRQFGAYISKGINPEDIEGKLDSCLKAIIANPEKVKKERDPAQYYKKHTERLSLSKRKEAIAAKLAEGI
ncbi:large subunit ribosomal protein L5e [Pancytospora epiphaga]|nr:large subunit ribosomal protein L5e [Pancytospora epiphaga]